MKTHYENLQVDEKASREVIEVAFRTLHEKWQPDKHPDQRQRAERASKAIEAAFKVLSSTVLRADYDASLKEQRDGELALNELRQQRDSVAQVKSQTTQAEVTIPEQGGGTLESKILTAEERFAEAKADGKRSREQGLKVRDCPYEGELREAWKLGFKGSWLKSDLKNYKFWLVCVLAFIFWKLVFSTDVAQDTLKSAVTPSHRPEVSSDAVVEEYARIGAIAANEHFQKNPPSDGITKSARAYSQGKIVVYEFALAIRSDATEAELASWRAGTRSEVVPDACAVLRKNEFFEKGLQFRYRYLDRSGQVLDDFLVNQPACEAL